MGTVKLIGEYYEDENFNRWHIDEYTEKQAIAASESLKKCTLCINCENCTDCKICTNCKYCISCSSCAYCTNCESCGDCQHCADCEYCEKCNNCTYCMYCEHCDTCESCEECTYLLNRSYEAKIISNEEEMRERAKRFSYCLWCGEVMDTETKENNIKKYTAPCCSEQCAEKYINFELQN